MTEAQIRQIVYTEALALLARNTMFEEEIRKIAYEEADKKCFSYFLIVVFAILLVAARYLLFP